MPYANAEVQKKYHREYQRLRAARRRVEWFFEKTCARCPASRNLELHHLNPEEKVSHRIWSWSWRRIFEETAKCIVLCYDCHIAETVSHSIKFEHGTRTMYMHHDCRCSACVEAARVHRETQRSVSGRKHQPSYRPK